MSSSVTYTTVSFCSLRYHLILALGFYSSLSGRVRTLDRFSQCVVSLLSSRFAASALAWFSNFLKYVLNINFNVLFLFLHKSHRWPPPICSSSTFNVVWCLQVLSIYLRSDISLFCCRHNPSGRLTAVKPMPVPPQHIFCSVSTLTPKY
jgi:hypothetical protein